MKICIYGAGAIGGYLGVQLARAGADISLVARGPHLAAMRENGLKLLVDNEERVVHLRCTDNPAELGPQDFVIICLKAHSISGVIDTMRPLLGPRTRIVTAVNGIPYWYFYKHGGAYEGSRLESIDPGGRQWHKLGPERAIGCIVYPATEIEAPGVIRHVYGNHFPLGEPSGAITADVEALSSLFGAAGMKAPVLDRICDEIWLKLWSARSPTRRWRRSARTPRPGRCQRRSCWRRKRSPKHSASNSASMSNAGSKARARSALTRPRCCRTWNAAVPWRSIRW